MPVWSVSEPFISLRLLDEPLGYQPALGARVSFQLHYRQLGSLPADPLIFGVGTNWSSSVCSFLYAAGGDEFWLHRGGAGWVDYFSGQPQARDGSLVGVSDAGALVITQADGTIDTFNTFFTDSWGDSLYFLTTRADPAGNLTTYNYVTNSGVLQLANISDGDGRQTVFAYGNPAYSNLITQVTDPFGRSTQLNYDDQGYLTNIVDVAGLSSSFQYDAGNNRGYITNLATPYGNTGFRIGGTDYNGGSSGVNRFVEVTLPTGGKHLYLYREYSAFLSSWNPAVPGTGPLSNTFENPADGYLPLLNSYYWGPLQYDALSSAYRSSGDVSELSTADYSVGRQRHWLFDYNGDLSPALSLERAPSPDGSTEGQITWYDYDGKPDNETEGSSDLPLFVAQILPDSTTHYTYAQRGLHLEVTNKVDTYTAPGGGVAIRTNVFTYAANDIDLLQWIGPNSEQVVSNYFSAGNTIHQPDASYDAYNQATLYTYNGYGQRTSVKNPAGLTTTNIYYSSGTSSNRLQTTIDLEIQRTNAYTYYANGLVASHTDERGLITTNTWDNLQRLTGTGYSDGTTVSNIYTYLDLTASKDRLGLWSYANYNAIRQKVAEQNPNGVVTGYSYCQCGLLYAVTNGFNTPAQLITGYGYDNQGNRTQIYLPDATITNWFDALGRVVATGDAWGTRSIAYNNQGFVASIANAYGYESAKVFDIEDRPVYVTDANQVTITNTYDLLGRLVTRGYPDGGLEWFAYTARGLAYYTNQIGKISHYDYDAGQRKVDEINPNSETILYTNNAAGDLLSLTDGKNQTTRWSYDSYGRVTNKLDQTGTVILAYQYDPNNRLTNRWSAAKGNTGYGYDNVGNLLQIKYPSSGTVYYNYDPLNRLTNMVDAAGTTVLAYTSGGELFTEDGPFASDTVTNYYYGRLRTEADLAQPTGVWTNQFGYDAAKRLYGVVSPAGTFITSYDPARLRLPVSLALPNGSIITNLYDGNARLLFTKLNKSNGTNLDAAVYVYNAANQRTNFVNAAGTSVSYQYDPAGQLKVATSSASSENRGYAYDAAWNLNELTNNGTLSTYSVNGVNELNSVGGTSYGYDLNGNLTNNGSVNYGYDDENRLVSVQTNGAPDLTTFVYDGLGRLREQLQWTQPTSIGGGGGADAVILRGGFHALDSGGGSTWTLNSGIYYIYDGKRVIQERDTNNSPMVSYTRGNDLSGTLEGAGGIGGLLARTDGTGSTFYHADGNGNITYLETSAQGLGARYRYDPFGNVTSSSGAYATANTYRFSSKEWVPSVSGYYYLYRFYVPGIERWLNRDPIQEWGGANLYCFCFNSSPNISDFFGLAGGDTWDFPLTINFPGGGSSITYYPPGPGSSGGAGASGNLPPARIIPPSGFQCPRSTNGSPVITSPIQKPPPNTNGPPSNSAPPNPPQTNAPPKK